MDNLSGKEGKTGMEKDYEIFNPRIIRPYVILAVVSIFIIEVYLKNSGVMNSDIINSGMGRPDNGGSIWPVSVLVLIIAAFVFYKGFEIFRLKQLIESTPTSKIRSAAMGLVEVHGKAVTLNPIRAPLSGKDCLYWQVHFRGITKAAKGNDAPRFLPIGEYTSDSGFYIQDDTGQILVDPKELSFEKISADFFYTMYKDNSLSVNKMREMKYGGFKFKIATFSSLKSQIEKKGVMERNPPPESLRRFCQQYNINLERLSEQFMNVIVTEYYLPKSKETYVMGTVAEDSKAPNNKVLRKGTYVDFFYMSDKHEKEVVE
ncbi:MAG: hypothetical protein AABX63_06110, partial [Nanoarchaeota archaeon]